MGWLALIVVRQCLTVVLTLGCVILIDTGNRNEESEMDIKEYRMLDINKASVEITVDRRHGQPRIWINVNGVCMLRAYDCTALKIVDEPSPDAS